MSAPERIWVWNDGLDADQTEYIRADLVPQWQPKVKPLVWETYNLTGKYVDGFEILKRSLNRSFNYFLDRRLSDGFFMVRYGPGSSYQLGGYTEDMAAKSAQDEHERRILSALPTPPEAD